MPIHAFNAGTFWVPGPEVYWMQRWNQREEMNVIVYLVRGGLLVWHGAVAHAA